MPRPTKRSKTSASSTTSDTKSLVIMQYTNEARNTMWLIPDSEINDVEREMFKNVAGEEVGNDVNHWVMACLWKIDFEDSWYEHIYGEDNDADMPEDFRAKHCPKEDEAKWHKYEVPFQSKIAKGEFRVNFLEDKISHVYVFYAEA